MSAAAQAGAARALRDLVRQTTVAGVGRRAALLHLDRLPPALAKPHHHRLARIALAGLAERDHAQSFELPLNRLAIVWRSRGTEEEAPMAALEHFLADMPQGRDGSEIRLGHVLSLFDLPQQGPWLLDTLDEGGDEARPPDLPGLDAALLARLEDSLAQADITQFLRWHAVMDTDRDPPRLAWEERVLCWPTLAAVLCPGRNTMDGTWLARRLTGFVDRRVLAAMTGPRELSSTRPFALNLGVDSILAPAFLAFDTALPAALRGRVILCLEAADVLADAAAFCFARNFARARGYRLLLQGALQDLLNPDAAGFDYLETALTPALQASPARLPARAKLVLDQVDDAPALAWARAQGCLFVKGGGVQG